MRRRQAHRPPSGKPELCSCNGGREVFVLRKTGEYTGGHGHVCSLDEYREHPLRMVFVGTKARVRDVLQKADWYADPEQTMSYPSLRQAVAHAEGPRGAEGDRDE